MKRDTTPIFKIGPSVLNADLSNLGDECQNLMSQGADYLHLDVMDGHFVPSLTFGAPVVKCVREKVPGAFLDAHMMVSEPINWVRDMRDAGTNQYTFHLEAVDSPQTVIDLIRAANMRVGLAIKPKTKVEELLPYVDQVDMVLVMTVEPGFGGQKFMDSMMPKVQFLRTRFPCLDIEVDGGVGPATIEACVKAGANMIVSGTAIIRSDDRAKVIREMKSCCGSYSSSSNAAKGMER